MGLWDECYWVCCSCALQGSVGAIAGGKECSICSETMLHGKSLRGSIEVVAYLRSFVADPQLTKQRMCLSFVQILSRYPRASIPSPSTR